MRYWAAILFYAVSGVRAQEIPLLSFAKPLNYTEAALSPDGRYLALTVPRGDETHIAVIEFKGKDSVPVKTMSPGASGSHIVGLAWVNKRRLVVAPGASGYFAGQILLTGQLYAVNFDGSAAKKICCSDGSSARLVQARTGNPRQVLIANRPDKRYLSAGRTLLDNDRIELQLLDIEDGRVIERYPMPPGTARIVALAAGERLQYLAYQIGQVERWNLLTWDQQEAQWRPLGSGDMNAYPIALSPDGQSLMVRHQPAGGTRGLYTTPLQNPGSYQPLAVDAQMDWWQYFLSADGRSLIGTGYRGREPELRIQNPDHPDAQVLAKLAHSFPGGMVLPESWSEDGQRLLFRVVSGQNPGELFIYERSANKAFAMGSQLPSIPVERMAPRRAVSIPLGNTGEKLPGFLTAPPGAPPPWPLVMVANQPVLNGYLDGSFDSSSQVLASRGYAVLELNVRGSDGYGEGWMFAAQGRYAEPAMSQELLAAADWAAAQGYSGPQGVCLKGFLWAVYPLALTAAQHPDRFRCLSSLNGIFNPRIAIKKGISGKSPDVMAAVGRAFGKPDFKAEDAPDTAALASFVTPLLAQNGRAALHAPPSQMEDFCEELEDRDQKPECVIIQRESDSLENEKSIAAVWQRELDFFARHLRAPEAEPSPAQ